MLGEIARFPRPGKVRFEQRDADLTHWPRNKITLAVPYGPAQDYRANNFVNRVRVTLAVLRREFS